MNEQDELTSEYHDTEEADRAYARKITFQVADDLSLDMHEHHMVYTAIYYAIRDVRAYRSGIPF